MLAVDQRRVVDVKAAVVGVLRVERQPQEPHLAAPLADGGDRQERRLDQSAITHDAHPTRLLEHEQARRVTARLRQVDRTL